MGLKSRFDLLLLQHSSNRLSRGLPPAVPLPALLSPVRRRVSSTRRATAPHKAITKYAQTTSHSKRFKNASRQYRTAGCGVDRHTYVKDMDLVGIASSVLYPMDVSYPCKIGSRVADRTAMPEFTLFPFYSVGVVESQHALYATK